MSERLRQLQHQRSLIIEHLAWLDTEIAREIPAAAPALPPVAPPPVLPPLRSLTAPPVSLTTPGDPAPAAIMPVEADALIERYAADERQNPAEIRRGCLGLAIGLFLILVAGIVLVWVFFYRDSSQPPPSQHMETIERRP